MRRDGGNSFHRKGERKKGRRDQENEKSDTWGLLRGSITSL